MRDDFLYIEENKVKVTEEGMQIPEFKEFKRYDKSTNKSFFDYAMSYIFYVYKVFGDDRSYLHNAPLHQRRVQTVKHHCGPHKEIDIFEKNEWVRNCIDAYLEYSRTRSERLFDALKNDIEKYIEYVESIPHTIKKTVNIERKEGDFIQMIPVEIDIPNTQERLKALKEAKELDELYQKYLKDVQKDGKEKKLRGKRFEDPIEAKKVTLNTKEIPRSVK